MNPSSCTEPSASVSSEKYVEHSSTSTSRQNGDKPTAAADDDKRQVGILKTTIQEMKGNTEDDEDDGWTTKRSNKKKKGNGETDGQDVAAGVLGCAHTCGFPICGLVKASRDNQSHKGCSLKRSTDLWTLQLHEP